MNYPESIEKDGRVFKVVYKCTNSLRSSIRFKDGKIIITLSRFLRGKKREEGIYNFLFWAKKKLNNTDAKSIVKPVYKDGGCINTHNKIYQIKVEMGIYNRNYSRLFDNYLVYIKLGKNSGKEELKFMVQKVIMKDQLPYLKNVINELNDFYFAEKLGKIRLKSMTSRFGSCSSKRNLNFSFSLLLTPHEVFRYVCIHELAHLKEMNHSKKFWAIVSQVEPEYKKYERWLKRNAFLLI